MHVIAAKAVAFKEALSPEFRVYQQQVVKNADALAKALVARGLHGGGAGSFTMMFSAMGVGGIIAALQAQWVRMRFDSDRIVAFGTVVHAAVSVAIVVVDEVWFAVPAMVLIGGSFIAVANTLNVAAQLAMPDWVRARGMSIYQMALMGGAAAGSLLWGNVAGRVGVDVAIGVAAVAGLVLMAVTRRVRVTWAQDVDFSPAPVGEVPQSVIPVAPDEGPVMVTVQYQIDPARAGEFAVVMERTRRARLRQGALSWGLFRDVSVPGRYIEYFVDENWVEHQRRLQRFTAFDAELRELRQSFQQDGQPTVIRRYVADSLLERRDRMP